MSQGRPQAHEESTDHPFGTIVRHFLSQKRLSQAKLAQITDLDPAIINKMIKGQRLEGPGGRHRVLTLIRGLHELGVLNYVDEANLLLSRIPTMGALDSRVKEELALLTSLKTREVLAETDLAGFAPLNVRLPNDSAPSPIKKVVIKDDEVESETPTLATATFAQATTGLDSQTSLPLEVIEPAAESSQALLVSSSDPTTSLSPNPVSDTLLEKPAFATVLESDISLLPPKTRFLLPNWGWLIVAVSLLLITFGAVFLSFGRSQDTVQEATVRNVADPPATPLAIILTNAGAVDLIASIQTHSNRVNAVAFSPDGQLMASGSDDRTVSVSLVRSKERLFRLDAHNDAVTGVAFSPDGKILASASLDKTVIFWRVSNGTLIRRLDKQAGSLSGLSFSPDGKYLAIASYDKTVYVWNVEEERVVRKLEGHSATVSSVTFSSDGKYMASGSFDASIIVWTTENWAQLHRLEGHTGAISSLAFMPETTNLASASFDSTVRLWKADDGAPIRVIDHPGMVNGVAFNPQGTILASVGGTERKPTLWLRRVRDSATLLELRTETVEAARGVVFSPMGDLIAIPFNDQTIKLWGVALRYLSNEKYEILR
jgi:WD40 repeat protein